MFILHSSNKTENLIEHLTSVIGNAPLRSPFAKEVFLIQSQGMERWLSQQLASRLGLWANYQFLFPSTFFSFIAQKIDSKVNDAEFDRSLIVWRLETLLRHLEDDACLPLRQYLSGTNQALKRFQLAQQLAQIFDQYQIMRPDLLAAWQQGQLLYNTDIERWQKTLWLELVAQLGQKHRGKLWLDVINKLTRAADGLFRPQLPERISAFGINTMPPLFLSYLQSLARHCDVHLYLLNPAQSYWADLTRKPDTLIDPDHNGHPLLASLGQQGREFQAMLLDFSRFDFEPESFETIAQPNNLQQLQNDILNSALSGRAMANDGSISCHSCHSRKREVEVLRDQLLAALESDTSLELRDIAVMAPDIQLYEPFISAVFHDIQHSVADRSLRLENQALDTFIRFLVLSQSRLGWQSVLDLLERDAVYPNFGLSETDLELIKYWIQDTHVRWGQSRQHKQELGLPELHEHTWQAALDRLLMGYAVGHDDDFIDEVLPYIDIEGSSALALGGLHDFLQLLFNAKAELKQAKSLKSWGSKLTYFAGLLSGKTESSGDLLERQQLSELLLELSGKLADLHNEPVELQVIVAWLEGMVAERKSANGFLRGQLTFCSLLPMRSIPFKVIALLGINEGEFPKLDHKPTFDLISQYFRLGDRSRRADDRYQFLEILLSARQQLIITYIGQSQANNETIAPSVVVTEMLDVLRDYYQLFDLITRHPLQAFSKRYFEGTSDLFSFSQTDCETAKALTAPTPEPALWWQGEVSPDPETNEPEIIEIADLLLFFQHPQRYFLRRHVGLRLQGIVAETQEREPFAIGDLDLYGIEQEWLHQLLTDSPISLSKLQAQGRWLLGSAGEIAFDQRRLEIHAFAETIKNLALGLPLAKKSIDLKVGTHRLLGTLDNLYEQGSLFYRFANLKGKDFLVALLHHLIINQLQPKQTYLISADDQLQFQADLSDERCLTGLIRIYQQGQRQPNTFFTEAAFAYLQQASKPKARKAPIEAAAKAVFDALSYDYDLNQLYGNVIDTGLILPDDFAQLCDDLLLPAWEAAHG